MAEENRVMKTNKNSTKKEENNNKNAVLVFILSKQCFYFSQNLITKNANLSKKISKTGK